MTTIINNTAHKEKRRTLRRQQTKEESIIWELVRNNNLGFKFKRQVSIGPYIADFYCREKQLVIELDGIQHIDNLDYDNQRTDYFLSLGIQVIRFWNKEVNNDLRTMQTKILAALKNNRLVFNPLKVGY